MLATLLLTASMSVPPSCDCLTCACASCACGLAKPTMTYREVRTVVECGMDIVVYAGVPMPAKAEANAVRVDAIPNEPPGVYRCWRVNGEAKFEPRSTVAKAMPSPVLPSIQSLMTPTSFPGNCPNGQCPNVAPARRGR